jgi:hypothetical protein
MDSAAIAVAAPAMARSAADRLPDELISLILAFVCADPPPLPGTKPYGFEGIGLPVSQVSQAWRRIYYSSWLRAPIPPSLASGSRGCRQRLRVAEALWFWDLAEVATFFTRRCIGLLDHPILQQVQLVRLTYTDFWHVRFPNDASTAWAYEAFERFYQAYTSGLMPQLKWVELVIPIGGPRWDGQESFHKAGFWNLLKLRGLQKFIISSPHLGLVPASLRQALRAWTARQQLHPWP